MARRRQSGGCVMARPRLPANVKARRGTLRKHREQSAEHVQVSSGPAQAPPDRDYLGIAAGYMADVLSGEIIVGKWARLAVERQDRDLRRAADDPTWPYVF